MKRRLSAATAPLLLALLLGGCALPPPKSGAESPTQQTLTDTRVRQELGQPPI
jgi:hypothetical protein